MKRNKPDPARVAAAQQHAEQLRAAEGQEPRAQSDLDYEATRAALKTRKRAKAKR